MHSFSILSPIYKQGDIKYYWRLHLKKMQEKNQKPITYARFWDRLERGWQLKDAIETPNCKLCKKETSLEDNRWRSFVMLSLCGEDVVDTSKILDEVAKMNKIKMPKPRPTLWQRIAKLFSKKSKK